MDSVQIVVGVLSKFVWENLMGEEEQLLAWIARDGEEIKSVWEREGKKGSLEKFAVELWRKKKRFSDILRGKV